MKQRSKPSPLAGSIRSPRTKAALGVEAWRAIFGFIVATAPERNRAIGESGLTPNDARALGSLSQKSGRTMGSLAAEWRCDASTATWILDRLEAKGLVERRAHPTDRRVKLVGLTALGVRTKAKQIERVHIPRANSSSSIWLTWSHSGRLVRSCRSSSRRS